MVTTGKLPVADELERRARAIRNQAALARQNRPFEQLPMAQALPITDTDSLAIAGIGERNTDEDLQLFADLFVAAPIELDRFRRQSEVNGGLSAGMGMSGMVAESKRPVKTSHIIESTLVKAPLVARAVRTSSGSLWSYSSPLPAVKVNTLETQSANSNSAVPDANHRGRKSQFKAPAQKRGEERRPDVYPSSSLWSYSERKLAKGH